MTEEHGLRYTIKICVYFLRRPHLPIWSKFPVAWHHIKCGNVPEEVVCVVYHGSQLISFVALALIKWLLGRQIIASIPIHVCLEIKTEQYATV